MIPACNRTVRVAMPRVSHSTKLVPQNYETEQQVMDTKKFSSN
jgi:hypothetical protein